MSTPTEQFSNLSLPGDMRFAELSLEQRKTHVRDILSSFDEYRLPSEFLGEIVERINEEQAGRNPVEWTRPSDVIGTAMQWGCHDEDTFHALDKWRTPTRRAQMFSEKLQRRFQKEFKRYDDIGDPEAHEQQTRQPTTKEIRAQVTEIAEKFRYLTQAAVTDLNFRSIRQAATAEVLLDTLVGICRRHEDLCPVRRSGRRTTSGAEIETSLYHSLIENPPSFNNMLEALEIVRKDSPAALVSLKTKLDTAGGLLRANEAPEAYQARFRRLLG
ncbi:uncharacterized protein Z518_10497 [Rhinocladiella mackenziei CBS 650.93]|uniref:Rhinocladiella mackenziei CBS 650.93 unplaced genomic scaffold supercont1.9, whole genome shotgun sequence n=1 Tax=Rhinocladiella mackenziei CBS 650.93 TaxID=1442369 RepID=A0A0D2GPS2_9EURO|nr:uncharacterized protein Z518_10497 [Rhinocladiella mackenziei CBS 650.93]KIX00358.1 hypothetical protein Z518_10497 [Rhinocladiella mackenziei CBS 650.93]